MSLSDLQLKKERHKIENIILGIADRIVEIRNDNNTFLNLPNDT